jgi:mannose/fructose/N-acetylgalactosamine-specific phosphotransferase system component IIC
MRRMATARHSLGMEDEDDNGPSSSGKNPELALLVTAVPSAAAAADATTAAPPVTIVTIVSIDDIPVSILYLGIGFAVVLTAYVISWIFQAVAFVLDLLLAVAFAREHWLLIDFARLMHCSTTFPRHCTKLLLASSLFTLVFQNVPVWYLPDYYLWIVIPLWIVKSFLVVAIVSRRTFLLVQRTFS